MDKFGHRLENLREKIGYTKKEVSFKLGFSQNVYGAYEREDRRPSLETLVKIAKLYNVSLDYLITGREHSSRDTQDEKTLKSIISHIKNQGIEHPYILDWDKWRFLERKDIEELDAHFEWVVEKAKKRKSLQ